MDDFGDESITRNRAARAEAVMLLARHPEAAAYLRRLEQLVEDLHREILRTQGDLLHVRAQVWAEGCLVGMSDEAGRVDGERTRTGEPERTMADDEPHH